MRFAIGLFIVILLCAAFGLLMANLIENNVVSLLISVIGGSAIGFTVGVVLYRC